MLDIILLGYVLNILGFLGMIFILLPVLMFRKIEYIFDYNNTLEYLKGLKKLHKLQTLLTYLIPFYGFCLFGVCIYTIFFIIKDDSYLLKFTKAEENMDKYRIIKRAK